jgi:Periplasmic copper-binding protein (NosD)
VPPAGGHWLASITYTRIRGTTPPATPTDPVSCAFTVIAQQPPQGTVSCGQVVKGNVTLTAHLNCAGDGLIVGNDGTIINMNGYGIFSLGVDSENVGIDVSTDNVVINGPGIISGFREGVLLTGATGDRPSEIIIHSNILENNEIGVFLPGVDLASVEENIIKNNNIAVASHSSTGINIESNLMDANANAGVTLVNTNESAVSSNNIQGSQNGVFLDAQSTENTIQLNNAHDNVVDLNNADGASPTINRNTFADNDCMESNPAGLCFNAIAPQLPMGTVNETTTQEDIPQQTTTQNLDASRILINDAIQDLLIDDITAALTHLSLAEQELAISSNTSDSINSTRVLVSDVIQDLQNGDTAATLTRLYSAVKQH